MKKLALFFSVSIVLFASCNQDKLQKAEERNVQLGDSLQVALAYQDSLFGLVNEISQSVNQIKDLEQILTSSSDLGAESQSKKDQLRNDIIAIQRELQARRERLAIVEARLAKMQGASKEMKATIANLKNQISEYQSTINTLKENLAAANIKIDELNQDIDSLNTEMAQVSQEKEIAQEESINLANELNTCYYAIGTKGELKEAKIIETGFLKKTKIMKADFEQGYFTTADKRTLTSIPTHAKKAKILTNQPASSYEIVEENSTKTIIITNPDKFWSLSNYLVIQVD